MPVKNTKKSVVTKKELVQSLHALTGLSKSSARLALDSMLQSILENLQKGKKISLKGFGTFSTMNRSARIGRNLVTGAIVQIPSKRVPKFKSGTKFKKMVT